MMMMMMQQQVQELQVQEEQQQQQAKGIRGLARAIHDGRIAMRRCQIVPGITVRRGGLAWYLPSIGDDDNDTLVGCYQDEDDLHLEDANEE
jgi:hypothetical protein